MQEKKKGLSLFWWGLLAVTLGMVWAVQRKIPFMMDDNWYRTLLYSEEEIHSLGDIISAQVWHYNNWGGRCITHGLLQMILPLGELEADAMNLAAMIGLGIMVCAVAGRRSVPFLVMAVGFFHAMSANWMMSMYWQSGACNYLYITIVILLFLCCYLRLLEEEEKKDFSGIAFWILPLGLCAGWSNENMGPTVWLLTAGILFARKKEGKAIRPWMLLGNAAALAGSVLLVAAPGNHVRSLETEQPGPLWTLFLRCYYESRAAANYLFLPLVVCLCLLLVSWVFLNVRPDRKELVLLAGALLSWGAMVLSPHYPDRASFGTMVFLICVILSQAAKLLKQKAYPRLYPALTLAGLLLWLRGMYCLGEYLAAQWGWIR